MTAADQQQHETVWFRRGGRCLGAAAIIIAVLVSGVSHCRRQIGLSREATRQAYRQQAFDAVKQGRSWALVMDSKLLPMLANDEACRRILTHLDFVATKIAASDAVYVSQLANVASMTFYCTSGTNDLLMSARSLPITDLSFEMVDLPSEQYLILKEFPKLERVQFEHVMDVQWMVRLKSELPGVIVDVPFPRSNEPCIPD